MFYVILQDREPIGAHFSIYAIHEWICKRFDPRFWNIEYEEYGDGSRIYQVMRLIPGGDNRIAGDDSFSFFVEPVPMFGWVKFAGEEEKL